MSVYFCRGGRSIVCNVLQIYIKIARFLHRQNKKQGRRVDSCPLQRALSHNFINLEENF